MTKRLRQTKWQQGEEHPRGSQDGPRVVPGRGGAQVGVEPTGRSRSLGGHQAVRTTRHVRVVEQVETFQNVTAEDVEHLEGRASALQERINQEAGSMARYREGMVAAANLTATQRRELQSRAGTGTVRVHAERASSIE